MKSWHVLNILQRLLRGEKVCLKSYAAQQGRSLRSLQRDIKEIKTFYGESLVKVGSDCYLIADSEKLRRSVADINEYKSLIDLYYMVNPRVFERFDAQEQSLIKRMHDQSKKCYFLKQLPFEQIVETPLHKRLRQAIRSRQYCDITYAPHERFFFEGVKPLRIVFHEGNWYLAVLDEHFEENSGFRWLRLRAIEEVALHKRTFVKDPDALRFTESFQTLFSNYKKPAFTVTLYVSVEAARYFEVKKHLRSQRIVSKNGDGSLQMEVEINNEMELLPLVKKWIPHLRIEQPQWLAQKLRRQLLDYLNSSS